MRKQNLFFIIRINLISILLGLFTTQSFAQNITITGTVKDQSGDWCKCDGKRNNQRLYNGYGRKIQCFLNR